MANVRRFYQKSVEVARDIFRHSHLPIITGCNHRNDILKKQSRRYESGQNTAIYESELESSFARVNSTILFPSEKVPRRITRIRRSKTEITPNKSPNANAKEERIMPTQTLPARNYVYITFEFSSVGWLHQSRINYYVESERPVDTWIVDEQGFHQFQNGQLFTYFGGFQNTLEHRQEIRVPQAGIWYLIIHNLGYEPTAIHYEASQL